LPAKVYFIVTARPGDRLDHLLQSLHSTRTRFTISARSHYTKSPPSFAPGARNSTMQRSLWPRRLHGATCYSSERSPMSWSVTPTMTCSTFPHRLRDSSDGRSAA
jgi:hypothetical protein